MPADGIVTWTELLCPMTLSVETDRTKQAARGKKTIFRLRYLTDAIWPQGEATDGQTLSTRAARPELLLVERPFQIEYDYETRLYTGGIMCLVNGMSAASHVALQRSTP